MSTFLTGICLLTIIVLTGCSFPGLVPVTQTPTAITSHPAALTLDELKNYTYPVLIFSQPLCYPR